MIFSNSSLFDFQIIILFLITCPQNRAAFEKEIEGLPSTRSVGELPPELHCPLCKEVMKDAVLTSKCCFKSFCYKCKLSYLFSIFLFLFFFLFCFIVLENIVPNQQPLILKILPRYQRPYCLKIYVCLRCHKYTR